MTENRPQIRIWLAGLGVFLVVIALGLILGQLSRFGIVDHQIAGTADRVEEIQTAWRNDGVRALAILAMIGDLIFIGIYGWGSWIAGRSLMRAGSAVTRTLGAIVTVAAAVFLITDYGETGLQFIQLVQDQGSDPMARTAAGLQPVKVMAWIVTFVGVIAALLVERFSSNTA